MDLETLEARKNGDQYHDFCIDDAIFHVKKALEILEEGLADPVAWYTDSQASAKILAKSLPFILAIQMLEK
jgi:hypothetical protein